MLVHVTWCSDPTRALKPCAIPGITYSLSVQRGYLPRRHDTPAAKHTENGGLRIVDAKNPGLFTGHDPTPAGLQYITGRVESGQEVFEISLVGPTHPTPPRTAPTRPDPTRPDPRGLPWPVNSPEKSGNPPPGLWFTISKGMRGQWSND